MWWHANCPGTEGTVSLLWPLGVLAGLSLSPLSYMVTSVPGAFAANVHGLATAPTS